MNKELDSTTKFEKLNEKSSSVLIFFNVIMKTAIKNTKEKA